MIDEREFEQLTPSISRARRAEILPPLQEAMQAAQITPGLREAHAMAQFLHESGGFQFKRELASGRAMEGRRDLGNTQPGDGPRYKGRGWIQITGRFNYRKFGRILNLPLEQQPELAETDENAAKIACAFWSDKDLNRFADRDDIMTITRRINGGTNGLADRRSRLQLAKSVLSVEDPVPLDDPEEPIRLLLNGQELSFDAFKDEEGNIWAPLRVMTDATGWTILDIDADDALLRRGNEEVRIPTTIRGARGFGRVRGLAEASKLNVAFEGSQREVRLTG
jgi:putative chitinase